MSIVVEDYHKNYGDTVAVAGISFSVAGGEILGLLGPSGPSGRVSSIAWCGPTDVPRSQSSTVAGPVVGRTPHRTLTRERARLD